MITDTAYSPEEVIEQPFTRMTRTAPLTTKRHPEMHEAQPSAPKQRSIYHTGEGNWESGQQRTFKENPPRALCGIRHAIGRSLQMLVKSGDKTKLRGKT